MDKFKVKSRISKINIYEYNGIIEKTLKCLIKTK